MGSLTVGYALRRLGMFIFTVFLGTTIIFIIPRLVPGDQVAAMVGRMSQSGARVENSAELINAWRARFAADDDATLLLSTASGSGAAPRWRSACCFSASSCPRARAGS